MVLLSSTSPLSFSHNKPPALSHWSSDKIIPPLFHPPLHSTLPGSGMTPQRQEMGICNSHFSLLPCVLVRASLAQYVSRLLPSSAHTWNGSQIISSTLSVVRQLLSLLVTSSPPATAPCSTLSGPSSIISIPHTVGVTTLQAVSGHGSHLYCCWYATVSLSAPKSSFCCWPAVVLSAHQGATVLVICRSRGDRKMEAEAGERTA